MLSYSIKISFMLPKEKESR